MVVGVTSDITTHNTSGGEVCGVWCPVMRITSSIHIPLQDQYLVTGYWHQCSVTFINSGQHVRCAAVLGTRWYRTSSQLCLPGL